MSGETRADGPLQIPMGELAAASEPLCGRREGPRDSKAASRRLGKRDGFPVRPESKDMENLGPYG